jgi:hypothetical protein
MLREAGAAYDFPVHTAPGRNPSDVHNPKHESAGPDGKYVGRPQGA